MKSNPSARNRSTPGGIPRNSNPWAGIQMPGGESIFSEIDLPRGVTPFSCCQLEEGIRNRLGGGRLRSRRYSGSGAAIQRGNIIISFCHPTIMCRNSSDDLYHKSIYPMMNLRPIQSRLLVSIPHVNLGPYMNGVHLPIVVYVEIEMHV